MKILSEVIAEAAEQVSGTIPAPRTTPTNPKDIPLVSKHYKTYLIVQSAATKNWWIEYQGKLRSWATSEADAKSIIDHWEGVDKAYLEGGACGGAWGGE